MVEIKPPKLTRAERLGSFFAPKLMLTRALVRNRIEFAHDHPLFSRLDRANRTSQSSNSFHDRGTDQMVNLVDRAQRLDIENGIARGVVDRCVDNVVSEGIRPQAHTADEAWNNEAERLFDEWAMQSADVRQQGDFYSHLQPLWFREFLVSGDVGVVLLKSGAVQTVSATDIDTPAQFAGDTRVIDGVRIDRLGRPVRFYVRSGSGPDDFDSVSQNDMIFFANTRRVKDVRGTTLFEPSIRSNVFDMIDGNIEAVVAASQMAAMFGLLITDENGGATLNGLPQTTDSAGRAGREFNMEPAMVKFLRPGETVTQVNPNQPSQNYPEFMRFVMRVLGLPFGLPLELILMDFSQTNYSSARASLLQAYRRFRILQNGFKSRVLRRLWQWRISKFINDGKLAERPDAFDHEWVAPGWAWVDPEKEAKGHMIGLDGGWETLRDICVGMGADWKEVVEQRGREIAEMEAVGVGVVRSGATRDPGVPGQTEPTASTRGTTQ